MDRSRWDKFLDFVDDLFDLTTNIFYIVVVLAIFVFAAVLAIKLIGG